MFTKLKEINEYIRKLTDAVKRNPVIPEAKDAEISTDTKATRNKKHKSGKDESTDVVGEKQKGIKEEIENSSMGHLTRYKNDRQGQEEGATEEIFDTKKIGKMEKTEMTDETEGKIPKERTRIKIEKDSEQGGTDVQGKRKKDENFNERKGDSQKPDENETATTDHDNKVSKSPKKVVEQKAMDGNKMEQSLDPTDLSNGKRITATSQNVDNLNENTEAPLKPNDDFIVEHNYVKVSRSQDHSDSLQSSNLYENNDGSDEDEIIQLTNYAKEEIAKHGDLSEKAIKNIIQIIKRKLINEGFIKPRNISVASTVISEDVNSTENAGNKTAQNKQGNKANTTASKQIETNKLGKGRILLYDKVVSNLMNAIKESSQPQEDNKQGSRSDRNSTEARLEQKSEMISAEKEQRKRMLSSLYLLSTEIENFKQFLGGTQNRDTPGKQKLEKQQSGSLKDETENKQATIPSIENIKYESNVKKYNTKLNGIMKNFAGNSEEKQGKNENEVEKVNQTRGKYSSYDYIADRNNAPSLALYKAHNYNEAYRPEANAINLSTDDATARNASPDVKQSRNITPDISFEDGEGTNAENFRYTKESTMTNVLSKPMLVESYESLMARIRGQDNNKREKQNSKEERNDISNIESAQGPEALIAVNASKRNSYTSTLAKTVEQYLTGMTVPALLSEKTSSIQSIDQRSNYHTTDAHDLKRYTFPI